MTDNYILTKDNLNKIVLFHTLVGGYSYRIETLADKLKKWDTAIFDEILKNQPELKIFHTQFQEEFEKAQHKNTLFTNIFSDKVKIESLKDGILKFSWAYKQDLNKRSDFFLELSEKSNFFFKTIFTEIKSSRDEELFDAYFKIIKKIKNEPGFDKNEAISNIKKYPNSYDLKTAKKKILAYLSILDKNQEAYDLIMADLGKSFKESASICNYWETKLKTFPDEISNQFYSKKVTVSLFKEKDQQMYHISLNPDWFVSEFKISVKTSQDFIGLFNKALFDVVTKNFEKQFMVDREGRSGEFGFSLKFLTDNPESMENVKSFTKKIFEQMPFIIKNHDLSKSQFEQEEPLKLLLSKCVLLGSLEKNLPEKEVSPKKMKI